MQKTRDLEFKDGCKGKVIQLLKDRDLEFKGGCKGKVIQLLKDRDRELKSGWKGGQDLKGLRSGS